jgi:serine/threonine protein kinase
MFSNVCVIVRRREGEALRFRDFEIVKLLGMGSFGKVVLASKKSKGGKSSSEEKLALKIVPHPHMLTVEREFFIEANGHPFVVQLVTSFNTKVTCRFKQSMTMQHKKL